MAVNYMRENKQIYLHWGKIPQEIHITFQELFSKHRHKDNKTKTELTMPKPEWNQYIYRHKKKIYIYIVNPLCVKLLEET